MSAEADINQSWRVLATETVNLATTEIDRLPPLGIVQAMHAEDATVAAAIAPELPQIAAAIAAIADRLRQGGRLIYIGAGTSGRLGALDAYECSPTFNTPPEMVIGIIAGGSFARNPTSDVMEDSAAAGIADLQNAHVGARDAVVGITASGRTPYVLGALGYARAQGALVIGLACNAHPPLAEVADITISPVVGPEALTGSTRLKAGTAQKMILNMLSTGVMILLGKTYGNLMVDVQVTNAKLQQRALDILLRTTGLPASAATKILDEAHGEVKTAIVAAQGKLTPTEARAQLAAHQHNLRATLDDLP